MRTKAQQHADLLMHEAVAAAIEAYNILPDGCLLNEYLCIVEGIRYPEGSDQFDEFHGFIFRDGQMRRSSGLGMLRIGTDILRFAGRYYVDQGDPDDDSAG